jgi:hypothetical protein
VISDKGIAECGSLIYQGRVGVFATDRHLWLRQ